MTFNIDISPLTYFIQYDTQSIHVAKNGIISFFLMAD